MKNEIEQQIFKKMKAKDFGESMCNETKLNVLRWTMQQLRLHSVSKQRELLIAELKKWELGYVSFHNLEKELAEKLLKAINCG